ncbi:MAG: hypothetical protein GQ525_05150, partial [Draconibacterium sp.]|nr:hypothetical protein [Draconibacterium sp.]
MKIFTLLFVFVFTQIVSGFAQTAADYHFKPLQQLKRQHGLQDPFLKTDGKRVSTKEEWA